MSLDPGRKQVNKYCRFIWTFLENKVTILCLREPTDYRVTDGEMAERSNAAVLKTVESFGLRGFESLSLRI